MKRTHDDKWLQENALFMCSRAETFECVQEQSFYANELHLWEGEPICEECFNMDIQLPEGHDDLIYFKDLPAFQPFSFGDNEDV